MIDGERARGWYTTLPTGQVQLVGRSIQEVGRAELHRLGYPGAAAKVGG
jgi:hypothetical protein